MPRAPRIEYPGAVYHVMARGDGGKNIFDNDDDRKALLHLLEKLNHSHGWKLHAYVIMGNHFHLLLETPEANLVDGMRWMMGVFALGWNRRRKRHGHVFQGRYKAIPVDVEEKSDGYFRMIADYIHLNPVRIGWVGGDTDKKLRSYSWSSFIYYGIHKTPDWITTTRVLEEFSLSDDRQGKRSYTAYLEARALNHDAIVNEDALKALRRGWFVGSESFGKKLIRLVSSTLKNSKRENLSGKPMRMHDEQTALDLTNTALQALNLPNKTSELKGHGRFVDEKALIAAMLRAETQVSNRWIAERLGYGSTPSVSRAVSRVHNSKSLQKRFNSMPQMTI